MVDSSSIVERILAGDPDSAIAAVRELRSSCPDSEMFFARLRCVRMNTDALIGGMPSSDAKRIDDVLRSVMQSAGTPKLPLAAHA